MIVAVLALVTAVGPLACGVHADGEGMYQAQPAPGVLLAPGDDGDDCDAQPAHLLVSRQIPDLAVVGVLVHVPGRLLPDAGRDLPVLPDIPLPGISSPLRI